MKRYLFILIGLISFILVSCSEGNTDGKPNKIRLDYATYSPISLVLKEFGFLEEELKDEGIEIEWVFSQGSNKALEFLNSNSVDFGSAAGAATLISKVNGAPIKNVYIFSKPEWTALVTLEDENIDLVADLKGKKIAATIGTDPYIFLLRALNEQGIDPSEVEIVNLQHGDGATALTSGSVNAWAGLDPHMARVELESSAQLLYRNPDFNTYGFLNVREDFAKKYPGYVKRVIEAYEKARKWTLENPEKVAEILAEEAQIDLEVAKLQLERNDFTESIPGNAHQKAIIEAGKILQQSEVIDKTVNIQEIATELIDSSIAESTIK
ncbi:aliphatic sulfonate ABC transporter substrate-binding protein [Caldibacillus thermolactis]|jgi:sulfonate transport system substrate-binding protein|uniref:Aliphatic sulfonate ABC transporter substrate-binding protein n=1 Tax=Pallidibacillus thermolactis TaxID=251051 RepID=A0ABT2WCI6_9BACI|nr:aliphatic sulfonate ABC transporter substrate-binding protein [Pallidibacillus thermolactis]MCU9593389.1 aliphatic sulfonate ABC transporter substrate-binding protein [Pallidibacillus thermolactis]MCU9602738.1 aliphatic sulfonate ABC transporter substrate-binding protein [Pallidibacillus thermolactis subsp. kokeshiiformis]